MDVREKLEVIAHLGDHISYKENIGIFYDSALANVIEDAYMELKSGVTVQEWISVDDRLPKNDVMVIGYTPCDGFMFVGYYHEEPKYDWKVWRIVTAMRSTKVMTKKVTHWMPLPQPPKGE